MAARKTKLTRRLLLGGSTLAILGGGALAFVGVYDAPAAVIHRLTVADHQRAEELAIEGLLTSQDSLVKLPHVRVAQQGLEGKTSAPDGQASTPSTPVATPSVPTAAAPVPGQIATISIPALQVTAPVLKESPVDGDLVIPSDVHNVGWDVQTPAPGQSGVTLLAGHVNWVGQGEGSMGEIGQLVPGDLVTINWDGNTTTWRVKDRPILSPNTIEHTQLFTNQGPPTLALVTCGGPFREVPGVGGSYADNVIVEASLVN